MKQLTGLDVSFLVMETPTTYGHVNGLGIYERPSEDFDPFTVVRQRLNVMVDHLEPLRRRLVEVPFELDRPYWIEDPHFDIDFHVRHLGLAPPGAADQLAEQVARIVGRKMDRSRPLWEAYVIEGLADGRWALLQKTHHATIDGASGVILLKMLLGASRDEPWEYEPRPWVGEEPPSRAEMLQRAARNIVLNPLRGMRVGLSVARDVADAAGIKSVSDAVSTARRQLGTISRRNDPSHEIEGRDSAVNIPLAPAPPTPWNNTVTPHRRFAMRSMQLSNLKRLKEATGGTLNDVVMAICTGALRAYLIENDALPDEPLRAMVPVSIRTGDEEDPWTNRVSAIVAELPTNCDDPIERVELCREAMLAAKRQFELVPADALAEATTYTSPVVAASAIRLVSRLKLADRLNSPINVVISNVPGPREPLYFGDAKLDAYIPVSTISDGVGLNITVHSYEDRMDFGLISDRELVPDLWHMVDLHIDEIHRLFEATGAEWAEEPLPPAMRHGGDGVEPVPPRSKAVAERIAVRKAVTRRQSLRPAMKQQQAERGDGRQSAAKRTAAKKTAAKKTTKKTAAKKTTAKRRTTKKTATKKAAAKKAAAKKAAAKKAAAKKAAAKKTTRKVATKKEAARKKASER